MIMVIHLSSFHRPAHRFLETIKANNRGSKFDPAENSKTKDKISHLLQRVCDLRKHALLSEIVQQKREQWLEYMNT